MTDQNVILSSLYSSGLLHSILSYLDTATLIGKKTVCKEWCNISNTVISLKAPNPRQAFESTEELKRAVQEYVVDRISDAGYAEAIASSYGWPIGCWDVSQITDMNAVFKDMETFNEDIGEWNVSKVTD